MWNMNSAECSGGMHDIRSRNVVRRSEEPPMADKSEPNIVVTDAPEATDTAVIADGLRAYNTSRAGYDDYRPLAVFVTDPATGKVARRALWRQPSRPAAGRPLLSARRACCSWSDRQPRSVPWPEAEGQRRGCVRVTLNTMEIQALGVLPQAGL